MHHHWPEHQQYPHIMCHWVTVNRHEIFHSFFHSLTAIQCAAVSWGRHEPPPVPTYIYTGCYTDWVQTLVTTISCPLCQSNGSLTCPFASGVIVGVHNEGGIYLFPFVEWQRWQEWQGNWKVAHESDWQRFMETLSLLSFLSWKFELLW